jgi:Skp family chaperone for outer membrane proteins
MKNRIAIIAIALFLSFSAQAAQQTDHQRPDLDSLADQLQLDSTQASQLTEMVKTHHEQMQAMRGERQQMHEEMHEIREQHRQELLTVLSYEQLYQFEAYMHQFRPKRQRNKDSSQ